MSSIFSIDMVDQLTAMLAAKDPKELEKIAEQIAPQFRRWAPQPGPQSDAYFSEADELLYGGAAGGGKTDLLLGLATTQHQRSVLFRNQSVDLGPLFERLLEIEPDPVTKNAQQKSMRTRTKRIIETGHLDTPGSERNHMGRAKDFIGFDEAALLDELRVEFVCRWLRSTDPKQRKRVVFATNPPMPEIRDGAMTDTAVGDWLIRWFAPWLDDTYSHPANQGDLRWCFMEAEGDRLVTIWVDGPGYYDSITHQLVKEPSKTQIEKGKVTAAKSRTFIRSLVSDNMFLRGTGYAQQLSSTPEPLRSMLLLGDFTIKGEDHPLQVIPTQFVIAAQERWKARPWSEVKHLKQLVLSGDIAQGGKDTTVLAPLYEQDYFDELITQPGSATPTGREVQAMIVDNRIDRSLIVLDGEGGWAGSTRDLLASDQDIIVEMFMAGGTDGSWDETQTYKFMNNRAKMWWEFRCALDPRSGFEICLPPSTRLRAQLTAPQFEIRGKLLKVESKDEIRKRIKSSTDEADAVLQAWQYREASIVARLNPKFDIVERLNGRVPSSQSRDRGAPVEMEDPRGEW